MEIDLSRKDNWKVEERCLVMTAVENFTVRGYYEEQDVLVDDREDNVKEEVKGREIEHQKDFVFLIGRLRISGTLISIPTANSSH